MPSLLERVSDLFTGSSDEQREREQMESFYRRVLREHPSTATGLPPPINIQVEERQIAVGRLADLPENKSEATPECQVLAPPVPTISSVSPASGSPSGGSSVTINGTNLIQGAVVKFGGSNASSVVFVNDTKLTCVTPSHAAGQVDVVVANVPDNPDFSATLTNGFNYQPAPVISGISPASGPIGGGTAVTITGQNFADITSVTFDGVSAAFSVTDAGHITSNTPSHAAGRVTVVVTNKNGDSGALANGFIYLTRPDYYFWTGFGGPTEWGANYGDIKTFYIQAILNGFIYTDYQGQVNVSTEFIGPDVSFNDSPDIDFPINVVNGIAVLQIQPFCNASGDTVQSLQFLATDATYGTTGDTPLIGVGSGSGSVGRKHGGGGGGGLDHFDWSGPSPGPGRFNAFSWLPGDGFHAINIKRLTAGGFLNTSFNGTATITWTKLSSSGSLGVTINLPGPPPLIAHFVNGVATVGVSAVYSYFDVANSQGYGYFYLRAEDGSIANNSPACTALNHL